MKKIITLLGCVFIALLTANALAASIKAPDSTDSGPHKVASAEYRLPATMDPDILDDRKTEIWAKVFYPQDIKGSGSAPLVVMLHGNHGTCGTGTNPRLDTSCEYTDSGVCPAGYIPTPNHEGYNYLAENLASWGFIVASVNANRGITCGGGNSGDYGLNLARGKLVLKHLALLHEWSTAGGAPKSLGLGTNGLIGKIDFGNVGLLGHSRGGEGVRAAYNLYRDTDSKWPQEIPGLAIKAIFEIGAVDGQTSRVLDADGTVWNQLLPMCDGDVSDLEGRFPFERMMLNVSEKSDAQKSLYEVWGANHNFFNTEWQNSDSYGCKAGKPIFEKNASYSVKQQAVALASVPAFFRSRLGAEAKPAFNQNFNPLVMLPDVVTQTTQVDRDFIPSPGATESLTFEDFDKATGTNSSGFNNVSSQIAIKHRNIGGSSQRAANISWKASGQGAYFEAVWAAESQGKDIHDFATLDFRVGRTGHDRNNVSTDFSIALVDAAGLMSKEIQVSDYALINGPGTGNSVLLTVRIPLTVFQSVDLTKVHSVRFIFDKSSSGDLNVANIRIQRQTGFGMDKNAVLAKIERLHTAAALASQQVEYVPENLNSIRSVRMTHKSYALSGQPGVEITVTSQVPFPAMNNLPILVVGDKQFKLSRYTDKKHLKELTFTLTNEEYNSISKDSKATVSDGKIWKFGSIAKTFK